MARCWATRTAPGVIPRALPVSSALMPTATRSVTSSRRLSGSVSSRSRARLASSSWIVPTPACPSFSPPTRGPVAEPDHATLQNSTPATCWVATFRRFQRLIWAMLALRLLDHLSADIGQLAGGDGVDEGLEGLPLVAVARQGRQHSDADLLGHVFRGLFGADEPVQPRAAVAMDHSVDGVQQGLQRRPVTREGECDQRVHLSCVRLHPVHRGSAPGRYALDGILIPYRTGQPVTAPVPT